MGAYTTVLRDAVKVKNAYLMKIDADFGTKYVLQHYDTIILEIVNKEVILIKPNISVSSSRAINQAFRFLGINYIAKDFRSGKAKVNEVDA